MPPKRQRPRRRRNGKRRCSRSAMLRQSATPRNKRNGRPRGRSNARPSSRRSEKRKPSAQPKRKRNAKPRPKQNGRRQRKRNAKPRQRCNARPKRRPSAKPRQPRSATPRARQSWLRRHHSGTRSNRAARLPTSRNTSTATRTVSMRKRPASACLNWRTPGWRRLRRGKKKGKRESRRSSSRRRSSGESEPVAEPDPEAGDFLGDRVRGRGDDSEVVLVLLVSQIGSYSQGRGDRVGIGSPEAETEGGVGGIVERAVVLPLALHASKGDASAELPAQRGNPCTRSDENPLAVELVLGKTEHAGCVELGVAYCVAAKTRDAHTLGKSMAVAARQGVGIVRKILLLTGYRIPQVMMGAEALLNREVDIDSLGRYPGHADIGRRVAGLRTLIAIADGGVLVKRNLVAGRREPAVNAERALGLSSRGTNGRDQKQRPQFGPECFHSY